MTVLCSSFKDYIERNRLKLCKSKKYPLIWTITVNSLPAGAAVVMDLLRYHIEKDFQEEIRSGSITINFNNSLYGTRFLINFESEADEASFLMKIS